MSFEDLREVVRSGGKPVEASLYKEYMEWVNCAEVVTIKDLATGQRYARLSPKRGNKAYASKMRKKFKDLEAGMKGLSFDGASRASRPIYRDCQKFLITFTYDPSRNDKFDAWAGMSKDIAKAKVTMKRQLGVNSIRSLLVKEGTQSGYPAPHMLLVIDRPVRCYRHIGKYRRESWRLQNQGLLRALKGCWKNGFVDIQAVVHNKVDGNKADLEYLFKYMSKSVEVGGSVGLVEKQNAFQKLYNLRTVQVSKQFQQLLNRDARLDPLLNESQQVEAHKWVLESVEYCSLSDFHTVIMSKAG